MYVCNVKNNGNQCDWLNNEIPILMHKIHTYTHTYAVTLNAHRKENEAVNEKVKQ